MTVLEEKDVFIVKNATERFYSWLELINVKEKESLSKVDSYNTYFYNKK